MKADLTRDTFDAARSYSRVLQQQGRVTLDADWNEQSSILLHYMRTLAADLIGPYAAPAGHAGFELRVGSNGCDILISPGRCYVDGILVENFYENAHYGGQPNYFLPADDPFGKMLKDKSADVFWLYLDVWERHITFLEDDGIREKALNGPDTCTRTKIVWQVKSLKDAEPTLTYQDMDSVCAGPLQRLVRTKKPLLAARVDPGYTAESACTIAPDAKYRGAENQLYRVEIHRGSVAGSPTFKWSRDNGSIATAWAGTSGNDVHVSSARSFESGDWVELTHEILDLQGMHGAMAKLAKVEGDTLTVNAESVGDPKDLIWSEDLHLPKLRRWNQRDNEKVSLVNGAMGVTAGTAAEPLWIDLEDGIQVAFAPDAEYRAGDYWLIPARVAGGDIEWPAATAGAFAFREPHGIEHHYAPLGFVAWKGGSLKIESCRCEFEPLSSCAHLGSAAVGAHLLQLRADSERRAVPMKRATTKRTRRGGGGD